MKEDLVIDTQCSEELSFLINLARFLSLSFQEQRKKSPLPDDIIANDTAEDWDWAFTSSMVNHLYKNKIIDIQVIHLFQKIDNNFSDVSLGGAHYEKNIWTTEGMEYHPFWNNQRQLAKELLSALEKIEL